MKQLKTKIKDTRASEFAHSQRSPQRAKCYKCSKKKNRANPMATCYECKRKFCFEHIWSGQINDEMSKNEKTRDICDECRELKKYRNLS